MTTRLALSTVQETQMQLAVLEPCLSAEKGLTGADSRLGAN